MVIKWLSGKLPYIGEAFYLGKKRKVLSINRRTKKVVLSK